LVDNFGFIVECTVLIYIMGRVLARPDQPLLTGGREGVIERVIKKDAEEIAWRSLRDAKIKNFEIEERPSLDR